MTSPTGDEDRDQPSRGNGSGAHSEGRSRGRKSSPVADREFARFADVVLGHVRDAVLVTDATIDPPGPRILYANDAFLDMTGFTLERVLGATPRMLQASETTEVNLTERRRIRLALERAEPVRAVLRNRRADGTPFWVELDITPVFTPDGGPSHFVSVQRDISDRHRRARHMESTIEGLQWVVDVGELATWQLYLPEERFVHNTWCAKLFAGDADGPPLSLEEAFQAIHPHDRQSVRDALARVRAVGGSYEQVFRVMHGDEEMRWVIERARLAVDDHGEPLRVDGVVMDVTDRYEAAQQVVHTLDSVTDGYLALDDEWRITHLNASAEAQLGQSRGGLMGRVLWEAFPELLGTDFEHEYRAAVATGEPRIFEGFYSPWERWYEERVYPNDEGVAVFFLDVTERVEHEAEQRRLLDAEHAARVAAEEAHAELAHAAAHDELTGLLNRREFERRLEHLLAHVRTPPVLLFFDLDDFKVVNDSLGHAAGDDVLCQIAERLRANAPEESPLCRFGGDEFLVAADAATVTDALELSERLLGALRKPYELRGRRMTVAVSVGVAQAHQGEDAATVIRNADTALFAAKQRGRDQVVVYDSALHRRAVERLDLEQELRAAVARHEFELRYQPIFEVPTGARCGAEALLQWRHPQRGLLTAGSFIAVAENSGLIVPIGEWVLEAACRAIVARRPEASGETLWINVAPQQLGSPDFVTLVAETTRAYGIRPDELGVELTERTLIRDPETIAARLNELHDLGVRIAIDDFGTGYSSMTALQHHPVDVIKIDRAFISQLHTANGRAIVGAVVELAHALDAAASAEGVEEATQWRALGELGCDTAAGFLMARPQPLDLPMPTAFTAE